MRYGAVRCRQRATAAAIDGNTLLVTWNGGADAEMRLRLGIERGQPIVRDLAVRKQGSQWSSVGRNLTPDFHVTSRVTIAIRMFP